jgi:hypothetical protein
MKIARQSHGRGHGFLHASWGRLRDVYSTSPVAKWCRRNRVLHAGHRPSNRACGLPCRSEWPRPAISVRRTYSAKWRRSLRPAKIRPLSRGRFNPGRLFFRKPFRRRHRLSSAAALRSRRSCHQAGICSCAITGGNAASSHWRFPSVIAPVAAGQSGSPT